MSDLTDKLEAPLAMSMFATKADLYKEAREQRTEAAHAIAALTLANDENEACVLRQRAVIDRLTKALAVVLFEYDDVDIAEGEPPTMTDAINCARAALGESK